MTPRVFIIPSLVIAALIGVGLFAFTRHGRWTDEGGGVRDTRTQTEHRAPDFALKDYDGNAVVFSQFRGRPVVVNSWAAWCPFCREELKDFSAVQREFGDRVVIIAIDRAESLETAKRYSDELGVTEDLIFLLDPSDSFYQSIGGFSMPETIFVDREGKIVFHKRGPMKVDEIWERVAEILNPKP